MDLRLPIPFLPDPVVEKIIGRIPFPFVQKARQLSKEWKHKLMDVIRKENSRCYLCVLRDIDAVVYSEDHGTQEVLPAMLETLRLGDDGTDQELAERREIFLLGRRLRRQILLNCQIESCGVLILTLPSMNWDAKVINVYTGKKKSISSGHMYLSDSNPIFLLPDGDSRYQIVTVDDRQRPGFAILQYKSSTRRWRSFPGEASLMPCDSTGATYSDGHLYYLTHCLPNHIVKMNMETGALTTRFFLHDAFWGRLYQTYAVRCSDSDIYVIILLLHTNEYRALWRIFKLESESLTLEEVAWREPTDVRDTRLTNTVYALGASDQILNLFTHEVGICPTVQATSHHIYLCADYSNSGHSNRDHMFDVYDIVKDSWSTLSVVYDAVCLFTVDPASMNFFVKP